MSFPTLTLEAALTTKPTETPSWTDISDYPYEVTIRRGRQHELDRIEAGIANILLDNADRRFDPTHNGALYNLHSNPSFETDLTNWSYINNCTAIKSNEQAVYGTYSAKVTNTAAGGVLFGPSGVVGELIGITEANSYALQYRMMPVTTAGNVRVYYAWYDSGGGHISDLASDWYSTTLDTWNIVSNVVIAPANAAYLGLYVNYSAAAGGEIFYVDAVQVQNASVVGDYQDGDQDNCRWEGTVNLSQTYFGGPYYGNLKPMRRIRLSAIWDGVTYDQFSGFVESWPQRWPDGVSAEVQVMAADALKVLGLFRLNTTYSEELSSVRIHNVLDDVGWTVGDTWVLDSATDSQLGTTTVLAPAGGRSIMQGQTIVQGATLDGTMALQHVQDVTEAENGFLFVDREGTITFYDRHRKYHPDLAISKGIFGDAVGELNYTGLELEYDDRRIYNNVRMQRTGGALKTADDATSKLDYFVRTLSQEALWATDDREIEDRANWMLSRYKDPHWRARAISFQGADDDLWPQLLARDIGDKITVKRRPTVGAIIEQDYYIEHVQHRVMPGRSWQTRWQLSLVEPVTYWVLAGVVGDEFEPYSILGTTTVLTY